jgi:hypothetical protein
MADKISTGSSTDSAAALPEATVKVDNTSVKIATPDLIIFGDELMNIETMTDLIFEDIGGYELSTISRHDLVNGQRVSYSPIKNLTDLYLQYNPNNIIRLQSSDSYFKSLSFSIFDRLPECGTGYTISPPLSNPQEQDKTKWTKTPNCKSVYIDPITGDLVINLINTMNDEQLEVQVLTSGDVFSDTIHSGGN